MLGPRQIGHVFNGFIVTMPSLREWGYRAQNLSLEVALWNTYELRRISRLESRVLKVQLPLSKWALIFRASSAKERWSY